MSNLVDEVPTFFEEASKKKEWMQDMIEEYKSIIQNDVWDAVPRRKDKSIVYSKWMLKTKHSTDDSIEKFKTTLVARGFSHKEGIDYGEQFSLVARYTSIITIVSLESKMKWKLHQMDVKTTFLNGVIEEEVYIEQPPGFETHDKEA